MGEAARRRAQGFNGPQLGERVRAALNEHSGGDVWELPRDDHQPTQFLVLDPEGTDVRVGLITNAVATGTPHRVVAQMLFRRGEQWLTAMIFDPCEEYRGQLFSELGLRAARAVHAASDERVDAVHHMIVHSSWAERADNLERVTPVPPEPNG